MESKAIFHSLKSDDIFENIVAETPEKYYSFVPYRRRKDLTANEKKSIGNYQDVHEENIQKSDWSFPIPENWKQKPYCYAINKFCRDEDFRDTLTKNEQLLIRNEIENIENAIRKSKVSESCFIYRGVLDLAWLPNPVIGEEFTEKAFGSFSLRYEKALEYTHKRNPIIFQLLLTPEMNALYFDESEFEILRPMNTAYLIINKEMTTSDINKNTTVYKIVEIKGD